MEKMGEMGNVERERYGNDRKGNGFLFVFTFFNLAGLTNKKIKIKRQGKANKILPPMHCVCLDSL